MYQKLAIILAFSLIVQPGILFPFLEKYSPIMVLLAFTSLLYFTSYAGPIKGNFRGLSRKVAFLLTLLGVAETFPFIISLNLQGFLNSLRTWGCIILVYVLLLQCINSEKQVMCLVNICIIALCVLMVKAQLRLFYEPASLRYGRLGSYGMYEGANDYALILTSCVPLIFKSAERAVRKYRSILLYVILAAVLYQLFQTGSRGGLLGTALIMTLCFITRFQGSRFFNKFAATVVGCLVLLIGAGELYKIREGSNLIGGDASAESRKDAWAAGGRILLSNPFGVGFDEFREHVKEYGAGFGINTKMEAHNTYVKVAADSGVIGLFAYVSVLYLVISRLMKILYFSKTTIDVGVIAIIQMLLFSLIAFVFNTSFSTKEYEWFLYILLACSTRIIDLHYSKGYSRWT